MACSEALWQRLCLAMEPSELFREDLMAGGGGTCFSTTLVVRAVQNTRKRYHVTDIGPVHMQMSWGTATGNTMRGATPVFVAGSTCSASWTTAGQVGGCCP